MRTHSIGSCSRLPRSGPSIRLPFPYEAPASICFKFPKPDWENENRTEAINLEHQSLGICGGGKDGVIQMLTETLGALEMTMIGRCSV